MKRKIITVLLAAIIIGAPVVGNSVVASASTPLTVEAAAVKQQASKLVSVASGQVGYKETGNNHTKYGAWYGLQDNPWCAMFVSWCANKAGISTKIIPKHASCSAGVNWFKNKGQWKGRNYTPKKGDLIYFTYSHVGIVESVSGGKVHTIEGNSSDMVARRSYSIGNASILGYGVPKYTK